MTTFKCKMCGGALEDISPDMRVGTCGHCGSTMTLPRLDSERKQNLYDRAGHLRRANDFDKAEAIYGLILSEDPGDAEAYWSLVLCRYGVEYVEDPKTHKRVMTCHRTQKTPVFADSDYKAALAHADGASRAVYEQEAATLDAIQKGILAISEREKPYDVFICYKESDAAGRRTPDSVLAQELYYELVEEGFNVFFSRITLEDKLGVEYEPYIYAALNSARVMVAVGTRAENLNAVWVKNEWGRYLRLINSGADKVLIPAYRDMDPYDLPEEFSHLQAQDMAKLGFMQDLVRGIKKILGQSAAPNTAGFKSAAESAAPYQGHIEGLLNRSVLFMEENDFQRADELLEQALNIDPHNARTYLHKVMIQVRAKSEEEIPQKSERPLEEYADFGRALRFADEAYTEKLEQYRALTAEAIDQRQKERKYQQSVRDMETATSAYAFEYLVNNFRSLDGYKDSAAYLQQAEAKCREKREEEARRKQLREMEMWAEERNSMSPGCLGGVILFVTIMILLFGGAFLSNSIAASPTSKYSEAMLHKTFHQDSWRPRSPGDGAAANACVNGEGEILAEGLPS